MFLKLALLNVWKYKKRTIVVLLGIALSVVVMQSISGMLSGMQETFFSEIIQGSGHVQLHADGWGERLDRYSLDYLIDRPGALAQEISGHAGVEQVEPILSFGAVVSNDEDNLTLQGHGVVMSTGFFESIQESMVAGDFLRGSDAGLVVSTENAELLGVTLGDTLSVLVQTTLGSPWYLRYPVTGLFDSDVGDFNEVSFFLPISSAQELLFADGKANEIRVVLRSPETVDAFVESNAGLFAAHEVTAETWRDIHGSILVFVDLADLMSAVINAFVVIVAASVITNAILMTAFDRMATFGALRAIGLKRRGLLLMLVSEGVLIGVFGSLLGLAIGVPLVLYFQNQGLDIGEMGAAFGAGSTYYFNFEVSTAILNFAYGVLIATLSAFYAGVVTARKRLIETLQEA